MCWCLEQLPDVVGDMEVERLVYVEAKECPGDLEADCSAFPHWFLPGILHTQMHLHWQNKEPEEWLCPVLQCHCEGEEGVQPEPSSGPPAVTRKPAGRGRALGPKVLCTYRFPVGLVKALLQGS